MNQCRHGGVKAWCPDCSPNSKWVNLQRLALAVIEATNPRADQTIVSDDPVATAYKRLADLRESRRERINGEER